MRNNIKELYNELEKIRNNLFQLIIVNERDCSEEELEALMKKEKDINEQIKKCVIENYDGHKKFSEELLSLVYSESLSSVEEYSTNITLQLPICFCKNMDIIEMAYNEGKNSV